MIITFSETFTQTKKTKSRKSKPIPATSKYRLKHILIGYSNLELIGQYKPFLAKSVQSYHLTRKKFHISTTKNRKQSKLKHVCEVCETALR